MPVQQQMSSYAARLGGRVAAANAEHANKPIDTGNRRLPGGIRNGIAKLSAMYTKQQEADDGMVPKGETFFRASAVVLSPEQHNGEKVAGMVTQVLVPMCDVPAKGMRKAKSFSENWYEFQNLFKLLGVQPPDETPQTDPTGAKTEAYYFAAMKALTNPQHPPVYVSFTTRAWTPPATTQQPKPTEMVFEEWHGQADPTAIASLNGQYNPGAGVTAASQAGAPSMPPATQPAPLTTPSASAPDASSMQALTDSENEDRIAYLLEVAMGDPDGTTEEGAQAAAELERWAWSAGWTKEQTAAGADWAAVADMALNPPSPTGAAPAVQPSPAAATQAPATIAVGSKRLFAKRTKAGDKLKNNKGEVFPPQEVEVVTVDHSTNTCTVKSVKDGKVIVDLKSKQPTVVKLEWLE